MSRQIALPAEVRAGSVPRGRPIADAGRWFVTALGPERSWAYCLAFIVVALVAAVGILGLALMQANAELASRQVMIVGETTAKQLVPLWPNGVGTTICDETCIEGSLESWVGYFRTITGETDSEQKQQHELQDKQAMFIQRGSPAAQVVAEVYRQAPPYALAAKGVRIDVTDVHADAEHDSPGRYRLRWTDNVTNAATGRIVSRHNFGAEVDAHSDASARTEASIASNPGGTLISDIHLYAEN